MNWKPKTFLIYPRKLVDEIQWPEGWGNQCSANLSEMLREYLKVKSGIGSEIKLIWNDDHRRQLIRDYEITDTDLQDYIRSDCSMLSFRTEALQFKAIGALLQMGAKCEYFITSEYREVILRQAEYNRNGRFETVTEMNSKKTKSTNTIGIDEAFPTENYPLILETVKNAEHEYHFLKTCYQELREKNNQLQLEITELRGENENLRARLQG